MDAKTLKVMTGELYSIKHFNIRDREAHIVLRQSKMKGVDVYDDNLWRLLKYEGKKR